ncbi:MAG: Gfo/Idh/MocA family oxidoreductase [Planctomycetes bacterium]|nr:Gfo/Idh/MocA family oxidoreductase [Planctomycetota bacterium]
MSAEPLKVAVIGVGHLGTIHARIYSEYAGAELVGVVDHDIERARALAEELGCEAAQDVSELSSEVDCASVVVPTSAHAAVAVPLLKRGIPLLVEKPLAANLEEADEILAAAQEGGAKLAVGHVERFQPGVLHLLKEETRPRFIECHRLAPFNPRGTDVGVVHDLMIHDLDLVLEFVGSEVESVDAVGGEILTAREDVASVRLVFANGARANVTASRASLSPMRRFRMFSSGGYASLDFTKNYGLKVSKGAAWEERRAEVGTLNLADPTKHAELMAAGVLEIKELDLSGEERPLQAELASFVECVRSGEEPLVSGADGRRALALAERIVAELHALDW